MPAPLSGAGIASMLAPYALSSSVPPMFYASSPLIGTIALMGVNAGQYGITFDSTQPLTCTSVTANGNLSVAGTLSGAGIIAMLSPYALTSNLTSYYAGTGMTFAYPTTGTRGPGGHYD